MRVLYRLLLFTLLLGCVWVHQAMSQEEIVTFETTQMGRIRSTVANGFWANHHAVVRKDYGSWGFKGVEPKKGSSAIRLSSGSTLEGSTLSASEEIVFQIPARLKVGDKHQLALAKPFLREKVKVDKSVRTHLKNGEVLGEKFGNPFGGSMRRVMEGSVKIVSETDTEIVIHLVLKAKSTDSYVEFDINKEYSLKKLKK